MIKDWLYAVGCCTIVACLTFYAIYVATGG